WASTFGTGHTGADGVNIELVKHAILSAVRALVNVPALLQAREHGLHPSHVPRFGSANEVIVGDFHAVPQRTKLTGDPVHELAWRTAGSCGRALDLLPVLVGASEEPGVHAHHALAACNGVAYHRGVSVADMRPRVHVVDGRRDVKLFGIIHSFGPDTNGWLPASPSSEERDVQRRRAGNLHTQVRIATPG